VGKKQDVYLLAIKLLVMILPFAVLKNDMDLSNHVLTQKIHEQYPVVTV
jgi:hypothetical protein